MYLSYGFGDNYHHERRSNQSVLSHIKINCFVERMISKQELIPWAWDASRLCTRKRMMARFREVKKGKTTDKVDWWNQGNYLNILGRTTVASISPSSYQELNLNLTTQLTPRKRIKLHYLQCYFFPFYQFSSHIYTCILSVCQYTACLSQTWGQQYFGFQDTFIVPLKPLK